MAQLVQYDAKYGAQTDFYFTFEDPADAADLFTGDATNFAAGDVKISKDGGAAANTTNLPAQITAAQPLYKLTLTATEMQAAKVIVSMRDQTASEVFEPVTLVIDTRKQLGTLNIDATEVDIADAVVFVGGATSGHGLSCTGSGNGSGASFGGGQDQPGVTISGGGAGAGLLITGGATGHGISAVGGATSGSGIVGTGSAGNSAGIRGVGQGSAAGFLATGGATGAGISGVGGATSGAGILGTGSAGNSAGISGVGQGSNAGVLGTGGATGNGISGVGGATSGGGIKGTGSAGNSPGIWGVGQGSAGGVSGDGGATGHGFFGTGGATSGHGIYGNSPTLGAGIMGNSATSGSGIVGDGAGTGHGFSGVAGASGKVCNFFETLEGTQPAAALADDAQFGAILQWLKRRFHGKSTCTSTQLKVYKDDESTVLTTQAVSDDGATQTTGVAS